MTWAHYRTLIQVADKTQRKALAAEAASNGWTSRQLEERVRPVTLLNDVLAAKSKEPKPGRPPKPLAPKRGTIGVYRITSDGDSLDLGFTSYLELTNDEGTGLKAGSLVRLESNGNITKAEDAKISDLYTYRAEVLRVVDGDTLWMKINLSARHWLKEKLRLRGLDCPEMDTAEGKAAKQFVEALVTQARIITITTTKPDKYDRYLSDVYLDLDSGNEIFLNNHLLTNGHAIRKDSFTLNDWESNGGFP